MNPCDPPDICPFCRKPFQNPWRYLSCPSCREVTLEKVNVALQKLLDCPDPKIRGSALRLIEKMKPKTTVTVVYRKKRKAPGKSIL